MPYRLSLKALLIATAITITASAAYCEEADKTLRVELPKILTAGKPVVLVGQYGSFGGAIGPMREDPASGGYTANIKASAADVKVLAYIPGYAMNTFDLTPKDVPTEPIKLQFKKLNTLPVRIKLTTTNGKPLANRKLILTQSIPDHDYFNYLDGMSFEGQAGPTASGVTDSRGMISLRVPAILDDPIYATCTHQEPYFRLSFADAKPSISDSQLVPYSLPACSSYNEPQIVKLVYYGHITGTVSQSFLDANNITEPMGEVIGPNGNKIRHIWVSASKKERGGSGYAVASDGSFKLDWLLPDTYDIVLEVHDATGRPIKTIPLATDYQLKEAETKTFELK